MHAVAPTAILPAERTTGAAPGAEGTGADVRATWAAPAEPPIESDLGVAPEAHHRSLGRRRGLLSAVVALVVAVALTVLALAGREDALDLPPAATTVPVSAATAVAPAAPAVGRGWRQRPRQHGRREPRDRQRHGREERLTVRSS